MIRSSALTCFSNATRPLFVNRYRVLPIPGFYADVENEQHTVYAVDSNDTFNRYGNSEYATADDNGTGDGVPHDASQEPEDIEPAGSEDAA